MRGHGGFLYQMKLRPALNQVARAECCALPNGQDQEGVSFAAAWIGLGLIAGFVGSRIISRTGDGRLFDIWLGVVGAEE